jgi:hypothetical protein
MTKTIRRMAITMKAPTPTPVLKIPSMRSHAVNVDKIRRESRAISGIPVMREESLFVSISFNYEVQFLTKLGTFRLKGVT